MADLMTWTEIAGRLADPQNYWLVTVSPEGLPHTVPVWGAVEDETLYLYSERSTVKARNIEAKAHVAVHLESGADVLIVYGTAVELTDLDAVNHACAAFARKYNKPSQIEWLPTTDPGTIVWRLEPSSAQSWVLEDMDGSQRRWKA
jgi:nitroimidazol reductase NimA-like FMN-containing flavoprotein (pyridoxamine 5'-phosphate oxidase superfamily)